MMAELSAKDPEIAMIWKEEIFDKLKVIWASMCEEFNLDPKYREYIFNVLYSVFLCPVFHLSAFVKITLLWILLHLQKLLRLMFNRLSMIGC